MLILSKTRQKLKQNNTNTFIKTGAFKHYERNKNQRSFFLFNTDCTEPNKKYDETDIYESVYSNEK